MNCEVCDVPHLTARALPVYRLAGLSVRAAAFVVALAGQYFPDGDRPVGRPRVLSLLDAVRLTRAGCAYQGGVKRS